MGKQFLVTQVNQQLASWQDLRAALDSPDMDERTLLDTLEGETELHEALLVVADRIQETEALAKGLKAHIADLGQRKSRLERTAETLRNIVLSTMDTANPDTITGPHVTLSRGRVAGKLIVSDEAQVPSDYWKPQDPVLDKKALTAALKDGADVPGAELSNGGISLTMRVK